MTTNLPVIRHMGGDEYEIDSESGSTYRMNAAKPSCECKHWYWRCRDTRQLCRHLEMLAEVLESQRACPLCQGRALILPAFPHADEPGKGLSLAPLACSLCEGTGLRSGCDPRFLRIYEDGLARQVREAEEAALKELFR